MNPTPETKRPAMIMGLETEYNIYTREDDDMFLPYKKSIEYAGADMLENVRCNIETMGEQVIVTRDGGRPAVQHIGNGSRFYLDGTHPELSVPECQNPREAVIWDGAGERIVLAGAQRTTANLGYRTAIYKKLTDGHGHTWGCHENYCIEPYLFHRLVVEDEWVAEQQTLGTWLVVRQLLTGAGKVGSDTERECSFQLSQRADFILDFRNAMTMINRPIINTRDEALADVQSWKRLHLICGDANLCQWSTYIKMGLTGLLLLLWQDKDYPHMPPLPVLDEDYPKIMSFISRDLDMTAKYPVRFATGRGRLGHKLHMSAANILSFYVEALAAYANHRTWSSPAEAQAYRQPAAKAQWAAGLLRKGSWKSLYGWLDWPTKRIVIEEYLRRVNRKFDDVLHDPVLMRRVMTLGDVSYSALDPSGSIFARLAKAGIIKTAVRSSEIARAVLQTPPGRATQRSMLINAYPMDVTGACWDFLAFRKGRTFIVVRLNDPMGSPQDALQQALLSCPTPTDFATYLEAFPISGITSKEMSRPDA